MRGKPTSREGAWRSAGKVASALLILALTASPAWAAPELPPRSITAEGTGTVEAVPDQAAVTLGTRAVRGTAREAQSDAATSMERVVARLLDLGIPRDRIRTADVRLAPVEPPRGAPAYEAVLRVRVTLSPPERAGAVIDAAVDAGAELAGPLELSLRDPRPQELRALALAVQDAAAQAAAAAHAAGIRAIRLASLEVEGISAPGPLAAPMTGSTPVLPGTLRVTARVRAVYTF